MSAQLASSDTPIGSIAEASRTERESAEVARILAECSKLEAEAEDIRKRASTHWMELFAKPLITAIIAAIVTGIVTWRYGLDAAVGLNELNERHRAALLDDTKKITAKLEEAEKKARDADTKLQAAERASQQAYDETDRLRLQVAKIEGQAHSQEDKARVEAVAKRLDDQQLARATATSTTPSWYAVVASTYDLVGAKKIVADFASRNPPEAPQVYRATDGKGEPVYAVTFGGPTSKLAASKLVSEARAGGFSSDAFAWTTSRWRKVDLTAGQ